MEQAERAESVDRAGLRGRGDGVLGGGGVAMNVREGKELRPQHQHAERDCDPPPATARAAESGSMLRRHARSR